jgi:hypothetical protein
MAYVIRNAQGEVCGRFTNKPGPGNKMPDGSDEMPIYFEDDPKEAGYDATIAQEVEAFTAAREQRTPKVPTLEERVAALEARAGA